MLCPSTFGSNYSLMFVFFLKCDTTNLIHIFRKFSPCSSVLQPSVWIETVGEADSKSSQKGLISYKFGLWLGLFRTFTKWFWSHFFWDLAHVFLVILLKNVTPAWDQDHTPETFWFLSRMSLYIAAFVFPSILTSLSVLVAAKYPHTVMLPLPCFTEVMVLIWVMSCARFPPNMMSGIHTKEFNFCVTKLTCWC